MTKSAVGKSHSYWIDENHEFISSFQTQPRIIRTDLSTNNDEYDIVIIGAGLSGVACAYWLRRLYPVERFPRILLLEKNARPCSGASGRNGGFLWPSDDELAGYVEDYGFDNGCQWVEFQHETLRSIARVVQEHRIDCDLNLTRGNLALAQDDVEWRDLLQSYEYIKVYIDQHPQTSLSLDNLELWDAEKCQQMIHSDKFIGALFMRESGTVWVAKLVYGLLNYCLNQPGVDLLTQGKVVRVEDSKKIILENGRVIFAQQAIVHASNAYVVEYLEFLRGKVLPTRGQCSRSKPIETIFWPFGLSARDGQDYYHQSSIDGRITFGGCRSRSAETENNNQNDSEINPLIHEEHEQFFSKWHPGIAAINHTVEIEQSWTGIMAFTSDHLPIIGPLPDDSRQFLLCGYNGLIGNRERRLIYPHCRLGNGMPNAFLCAKAVARMIAQEDPYAEGKEKNTVTFLQMFSPDRFTASTTTPSAKTIEKLLE